MRTTTAPLSRDFEVEGEFRGFFRDMFGRRRMVLKTHEGELFLKVPKELRRQLSDQLHPGAQILARGYFDPEEARRERRIVTEVQAGDAICLRCPIRVCVKKNCWRQGGKELWQELEREIAEHGLEGSVTLEGVNCLDHCKKAPNAELAGQEFHRCVPSDAARILAPFLKLGKKTQVASPSGADI